MITVTLAELEAAFARCSEMAGREPLAIAEPGGDGWVLLSIAEYRRLKARDRRALHPREMSDDDLRALARAEPPDEAAWYNHELDP
jgi:PHD/YefM family antitoxin component YafN of YafNO toxin-antitoxin module